MQTTWPWPAINPNFERKSISVTFLDNAEDVCLEGRRLQREPQLDLYIQKCLDGDGLIFRVETFEVTSIVFLVRTHIMEWCNRCRPDSRRPFRFAACLTEKPITVQKCNKDMNFLGEWMSRYNSLITGEKIKRKKKKRNKK